MGINLQTFDLKADIKIELRCAIRSQLIADRGSAEVFGQFAGTSSAESAACQPSSLI
jgi:hypothetical protein